jgi:putative protease
LPFLTYFAPVKKKIELLAPGGDVDSIKAAILAGADAVYCGLEKFNARNRAANITFDELQGVLRLAHRHNCQVFLTLNIIVVDSEIPALIILLNKLINTTIDGVIVQDFGLFYLLSRHFNRLKLHASTQLTTHNEGQIQFLSMLKAARVNFSRELNIHEIDALTKVAHQNNCLTEVFVHGSYCLSFSGICYMSSVHRGNSGNRGRCSQPCRDRYITTAAGKDYPLNLKDNSAFTSLRELYDAGVDSLKIEGRIKKYDYVFKVVETWRKQLQYFYNEDKLTDDNSELYKVFNRDFSTSFLTGKIHKEQFIDNPRDHSVQHHSAMNLTSESELFGEGQAGIHEEKEKNKTDIGEKIRQLIIAKTPLLIDVSGTFGSPLKVTVETPEKTFVVLSKTVLANSGTEALDEAMVMKRFKAINETEYYIGQLTLFNLQPNVYLPFNDLTFVKNQILFILNNSIETVVPIKIPVLKKENPAKVTPALSVLISSPNDLYLCNETSASVFYQLPDGLKYECDSLINLFNTNKKLIPWFPSILIGDDYRAAVKFLHSVQPKLIVTNNTGVAYEAFKKGIEWIAGPYLNVVNSYSLISLKETFNCSGAFISNEISKTQLQQINKPDGFKLFYSIYHPIRLMTSRQCLFHQVTSCEKSFIDETCIEQCRKTASIKNMKDETFFIEKRKGHYCCIYNATNYLNTEVVTVFPNLFSGFMIDLSDVKTKTTIAINKENLIVQFQNLMNGKKELVEDIEQHLYPTMNTQYRKGI